MIRTVEAGRSDILYFLTTRDIPGRCVTMKKILVVLTIAGCAGLFQPASVAGFAPSPTQTEGLSAQPAPTRRSPVPELRRALAAAARSLPDLKWARLSPDGRRLEAMGGTLSRPIRLPPAEVARAFLRQYAELLGVRSDRADLEFEPVDFRRLDSTSDSPSSSARTTRHYRFAWKPGGVPVDGAFVDIHLGPDGTVSLVGSSLPAVDRFAGRFLVSGPAARDAARSALRGDLRIVPAEAPTQCWKAEDGVARAAWRVRQFAHQPVGAWETLIDAETGRELSRANRADFNDPQPPFTGRGQVYLHHPLVSPLTIEPLPNLTHDTLEGLYAGIQNEDHFPSRSSTGQHVWPPENTHFDEVMAYYHVNRAHDFYTGIGGGEVASKPINVCVHYGDDLDNAYYMPWAGFIVFGDGARYHPLSREESVIYHEYAHAIVDRIKPLRGPAGSALNEAQADYFAATQTDDPKIGEYVVSKMNRPYMRLIQNTNHYPEDLECEPHHDSLIWSGALWDLRECCGAADIDRLVFRSLYYSKDEMTWADGLAALLQADQDHFDGKLRERLLEIFGKRGFTVSGPGHLSSREIRAIARFEEEEARPLE